MFPIIVVMVKSAFTLFGNMSFLILKLMLPNNVKADFTIINLYKLYIYNVNNL